MTPESSLGYLNSDGEATIQAVNRNQNYLAEVLNIIRTSSQAGLPCYPNFASKDRNFEECVTKKDSTSFDLKIRVVPSYEKVAPVVQDQTEVLDLHKSSTVVVEKTLRRGRQPGWWRSRLKEMELEIGILGHEPVKKSENIINALAYGWEQDPVIPMLILE